MIFQNSEKDLAFILFQADFLPSIFWAWPMIIYCLNLESIVITNKKEFFNNVEVVCKSKYHVRYMMNFLDALWHSSMFGGYSGIVG